MTDTIKVLIDASFVLAVTGAAIIWAPLALVVGAGFLLSQAVLADRRQPEAK